MPRWDGEFSRNRQVAIANGDEFYMGHPCKHGHPGKRMLKYHGKCFDCHKGKNPYYHGEGVPERLRARRIADPRKVLFQGAKARARQLGREFSITEEDIVIPELCPISGQPMVPCTPHAPSLDRVDSARGYTPDNIQVISKRMNSAKNNMTTEEARRLADYMQAHELLK